MGRCYMSHTEVFSLRSTEECYRSMFSDTETGGHPLFFLQKNELLWKLGREIYCSGLVLPDSLLHCKVLVVNPHFSRLLQTGVCEPRAFKSTLKTEHENEYIVLSYYTFCNVARDWSV